MLIVMHHSATDEQVQAVIDAVEVMGLTAEPIPGSLRTAIGVLGNQGCVDDTTIRANRIGQIIDAAVSRDRQSVTSASKDLDSQSE